MLVLDIAGIVENKSILVRLYYDKIDFVVVADFLLVFYLETQRMAFLKICLGEFCVGGFDTAHAAAR